jgi:hypothetical protein
MANNRLLLRNKRTGDELILAISHVGTNGWTANEWFTLDRLQEMLDTEGVYTAFEPETDFEVVTELAQTTK